MLDYFWLLFCFSYISSSVCLCECPGLPLLSGKHYRVSLESLSKPAQNSSTLKGTSLVTYCKRIHTEHLAYLSCWCDLFYCYYSFPCMSTSRDSLKVSFFIFFLHFLRFPVQRFHWRTLLPCCLDLFFPLFDFLTFSVSLVYLSPGNVVYFSYNCWEMVQICQVCARVSFCR